MKKYFSVALVILLALSLAACATPSGQQATPAATAPANPTIRVSTTTSVNDSGLLGYLQPLFEKETGYKLEITSQGTGAAIKLGETGDADVLLVHAKAAEEEFIGKGFGVERIPFMYNYFVIVGPKSDPAGVAKAKTASDAFKAIAQEGKAGFISRGDDSGTHKAELKIWEAAGIQPKGDWYISAGAGMGASLNTANEKQAYILTDKATYLSMKDNLDLEILLEKNDELKNTYSLIAVNPESAEGINAEGAQAFITWMTSKATLDKIAKFGVDKYGEALFYILK
ncbi:MAG: substrate-binding domain-containing protein [Bacillota bacterium]